MIRTECLYFAHNRQCFFFRLLLFKLQKKVPAFPLGPKRGPRYVIPISQIKIIDCSRQIYVQENIIQVIQAGPWSVHFFLCMQMLLQVQL